MYHLREENKVLEDTPYSRYLNGQSDGANTNANNNNHNHNHNHNSNSTLIKNKKAVIVLPPAIKLKTPEGTDLDNLSDNASDAVTPVPHNIIFNLNNRLNHLNTIPDAPFITLIDSEDSSVRVTVIE